MLGQVLVTVEPGQETVMAPVQAQAVVSVLRLGQVSAQAMGPETMGSDHKMEPVSAPGPASGALWVLVLVTVPVIKEQVRRMAQASEPERKNKIDFSSRGYIPPAFSSRG